MILDWQSAARGPALYDVARFLGESLHGPEAHAELFSLYHRYIERLRKRGVELGDVKSLREDFSRTLMVVFAGFASTCGNKAFDDFPRRLQELMLLAISTDRLGGLAEQVEFPGNK